MEKFRRTVAFLTTVALVGLSIGCASNAGNNAASSSAGSEGDSPVTFNVFFNAPYIVGYPDDGGPYKKVILDKAAAAGIKNIDYKVNISGGPDYDTKLSALAAAGDLPDYFSVDMNTMINFADQGLIMPVGDLLTKYAPHLSSTQRKEDLQALSYNGKLYAITNGYLPGVINGPNTLGYLIRQDWLNNLGLKMPETLDQLHDVLKAFKDNDPDKDGKNDTNGLSTDKTEGDTPFRIIFGAYGIIPTFWVERNGKLQEGFTLPETKQALKTLQDWYKEGLIDPDFPVNEAKQLNSKVSESKVGVWPGSANTIDNTGNPQYNALVKATPSAKISFLTPPAGPENKRGVGENGPAGAMMAISAKAKDPVRLMKLIDWTVDDSEKGGFWLVTYGEEGKDYTYDKQKELITTITGTVDKYKVGLGNPVRFGSVVDRRWIASDNARNAIALANKYSIHNAFWQTTPAMFDYPDLDKKLWPEYAMKIILGQLPVDAWDEFVKKYYAQGGKTIEDQVNAAWKKQQNAK